MRKNLDQKLWKYNNLIFCGVDEVGRGSLAGPVVAAAVILPRNIRLKGVRDSKELTPRQRSLLFPKIKSGAISLGIGIVNNKIIDQINIRNASFLAMKKAIAKLKVRPDLALVDGFSIPDLTIDNNGITRGDKKSLSIACASIIAKVIRDEIMKRFHQYYPDYGFAKHKGYPTRRHIQALKFFGPTPIHRQTFAPVKNCTFTDEHRLSVPI
ncbi:MAG: ribonuclease HII [candidate division WOR-3 bacterium]|nr:ribonuclease HII [candidate division WOR-3 bacterium]